MSKTTKFVTYEAEMRGASLQTIRRELRSANPHSFHVKLTMASEWRRCALRVRHDAWGCGECVAYSRRYLSAAQEISIIPPVTRSRFQTFSISCQLA